MTPRSDAVGN